MESFHNIPHFNVWAILVSGLILWFLGATWYSPALFAKPWMAALNIVPSHEKKGMIASLVGDILLSFVLLHFVLW